MLFFSFSFSFSYLFFPFLSLSFLFHAVPSPCYICGKNVAIYECKDCLGNQLLSDDRGGFSSLCKECNENFHSHPGRKGHSVRPVPVPRDYNPGHCPIQRHVMELFAVVSIETSHYVSFVKCGVELNAPWCFFDSMADRKGQSGGFGVL